MSTYATLKDVAKKAGTTAGTVSYVLSEKKGRYISEETRQKVLAAVEELNYVKSNNAASLKGKETKLIGILVPQFENQFFTRIIVAAEKVFESKGYDIIISDTFDKPEREKESLIRLLRQRVSGIVLTPTVEGVENTEALRKIGLPLVVVDRPLPGVDSYFWVTTDNYRCGEIGAKHLLDKGHRSIAYIGWDTNVKELVLRKQAVLDSFNGKGQVFVEDVEFNDESAYKAVKKVISDHPEITAVFFGFNMQAKGGIKALADMGKTVGKDISVILIGSPEWVSAGNNDFTHVDMGDYELGRKAADCLMNLLENKDCIKERIIQNCSLVEGSSVMKIN